MAIKIIPHAHHDPHVREEIALLRSCKHTNVVRMECAYVYEDTAWVVMEYCGKEAREAAEWRERKRDEGSEGRGNEEEERHERGGDEDKEKGKEEVVSMLFLVCSSSFSLR